MSTNLKYGLCISLGIFVLIGGSVLCLLFGQLITVSLFPYFICAEHTASNLSCATLIFVTLLEWPLYGLVLANGWAYRRFSKYVFILASIHAVAIVIALWVVSTYPPIQHRTNWSMG
jgi:hypothetical protein